MLQLPEIAGMLTGYTRHISEDGVMQSVVDSPTWKHINSDVAFDNFGMESRNMAGFGVGWRQSLPAKQHKLVYMACVDPDIQFGALVCH